MCIGIQVNKKKIGALLAYVTTEVDNVSLRKLIKLIYLIDEEYVKKNGYPLTWMDYFVWCKGPVAPAIYSIKDRDNNIFSDYVYAEKKETDSKYLIHPSKDIQLSEALLEFGDYHINFIDSVLSCYGHLTADELTDITHKSDTLWSIAVKKSTPNFEKNPHTDIKINFEDLLEEGSEASIAYSEALDNIQFAAALRHRDNK